LPVFILGKNKVCNILINNRCSLIPVYHKVYSIIPVYHISQLRHFIPTFILLAIYRSLIHPYISYGLSVWGQTTKLNLKRILILQKRAPHLIFLVNKREHAIPLFIPANILPVDMPYCKSMSVLMHDINCKTAPSKLLVHLFTCADSVHSYNTRSASAGRFYIKHSRLKQQSHSFSRIGYKIWNGLPEHLRTKNNPSFKKCLQQTLLQLSEHKENYVDVHTLIQKIPSFGSLTTNSD